MRRLRVTLAAATLAAASGLAAAQAATSFDGAWNVTLSCPPHNGSDDDAKGYTQRFKGEVTNGQMRAVHGTEGEPGWHLVTGPIAPDGSATLQFEGIVYDEKYAIKNAQRGKPYKYKIKAKFEANQGSGERLTGRVCHYTFSR